MVYTWVLVLVLDWHGTSTNVIQMESYAACSAAGKRAEAELTAHYLGVRWACLNQRSPKAEK